MRMFICGECKWMRRDTGYKVGICERADWPIYENGEYKAGKHWRNLVKLTTDKECLQFDREIWSV